MFSGLRPCVGTTIIGGFSQKTQSFIIPVPVNEGNTQCFKDFLHTGNKEILLSDLYNN
jgi:hypothetical protein